MIETYRLNEQIKVEYISHSNPYDFSKIHRHSYFEIFLFEKGHGGIQTIDFNDYIIHDRNLYIVAPNQIHLLRKKKTEEGIVIQFSREFLKLCLPETELYWLCVMHSLHNIALPANKFDKLYNSFLELKAIYNSDSPYKMEKLRQFFAYTILQIIEQFPETQPKSDTFDISYKFLYLIDKHLKDRLKVYEYANKLNLSQSALNKQIKHRFGKTPSEIIDEFLLIEIKRLLTLDKLSNKEISNLLNFDSQGSYNRFIKKHTNLTPNMLKKAKNCII